MANTGRTDSCELKENQVERAVKFVEVHRHYSRHGLHGGDDLALRHRLTKCSCSEGERIAQGFLNRCQHKVLCIIRVHFDPGSHSEIRLSVCLYTQRNVGIARHLHSREEVLVGWAALTDRLAIGAGDSHEHAADLAAPRPGCQSLSNAGEGASKIFVVLQRDDAIQSHDGQWCIAACIVKHFGVSRPAGVQWVCHTLDAQWARHQQAELSCFDQSSCPNAFTIRCAYISLARRRASACKPIAKFDACFLIVTGVGYEDALARFMSIECRHFVPLDVVDVYL